jgi:phospholipid/cholesterol/gamma-HCH transport system ATP-binding protein
MSEMYPATGTEGLDVDAPRVKPVRPSVRPAASQPDPPAGLQAPNASTKPAAPPPATTPAKPARPVSNGGTRPEPAVNLQGARVARPTSSGVAAPTAVAAPPAAAAPAAVSAPAAAAARAAAGAPTAEPSPSAGRENQPGTNQSLSTWNLEAIIELKELKKAFGSFRVLDGVTCRIPKKGVTVLMGPSGTGKSVTLRHIVGLMNPDGGDIIVDGKSVPKLREKEILQLRRSIGMLFQDGALFSSMNLYDNVAFPLRQHTKQSEAKIREIVMQRLSEVGLAGAEKRMPNELSGGMRKRAGFARALVMEPKILLFDEPDSGLDPVRTTLLCDLIREITEKYNATSIVISHDVNGVRRMADFIGILYKGKMRHFGTKQEIENSPDEFVKQFFNAESEGPLGMD